MFKQHMIKRSVVSGLVIAAASFPASAQAMFIDARGVQRPVGADRDRISCIAGRGERPFVVPMGRRGNRRGRSRRAARRRRAGHKRDAASPSPGRPLTEKPPAGDRARLRPVFLRAL